MDSKSYPGKRRKLPSALLAVILAILIFPMLSQNSVLAVYLPDTPDAPTITVTPGNKTNTITWSEPANGGAAITKYQIKRGDTVLSNTHTTTSYTDTGLSNGTIYAYTVSAYNMEGWGKESSVVYGTPRTVPSAPGAPSVSPGNGQVTISWSAPANGGAIITKYEVFQNNVSIGTTSNTSLIRTGLSNGTSYSYSVRAYNAAGWGSQSASTSATPRANAPSAPNAPSVSPGNGQVTISWSAPANNGATITSYEVFQNGVSIGTTASTSMTKTGLANGASYSYTVRAYNTAGWGNQSTATIAVPRTVPSTPGAPTVSPGNGQVAISWTAPAANGAAITNYEVFQNGVSIGTTTSLSMTKTGLSNGTSYSYTVRAYNAAGWGATSASTGGIPRTVPSAPNAPSVMPGNGQVTISWAAPAANGAAITNYEVFQNGVSIGMTTSLSMVKSSLSNGTNYSYTVRAYNAVGWGNQSAATGAIPRTVPNAPAKPSVTSEKGQVTVRWTPPANGGAVITEYEITRRSLVLDTRWVK